MKKLQSPLLCVALDVPNQKQAYEAIEKLHGLPLVFKIGLELFISEGPKFVKEVATAKGLPVFLDLKLHDIPNTVEKATLQAAELGVQFLTIHLSGGKKMCEGADQALKARGQAMKLLGVSVLTSFDDASWEEVSAYHSKGASFSAQDSVLHFAKAAKSWGLKGLVLSAHELALVRPIDPSMTLVVPGIRPKGTDALDQNRVMTPIEAKNLGADLLVMGRPILSAKDPRAAAESVLRELGVL